LENDSDDDEGELVQHDLTEFQIDETFRIPRVGTILGGLLTQGTLTEGTSLLLGPLHDGSFKPVSVTSIRRHKIPCRALKASQSASIGLDVHVDGLRRGMVLLSPMFNPTVCLYFQASIKVLYHTTALSKGFQTTLHIGNVRQTAVIEEILIAPYLATNDSGSVIFRFIQHPEYIKVGSRLFFRAGRTKGYGNVTHLYPLRPGDYSHC
jgi:GTPase